MFASGCLETGDALQIHTFRAPPIFSICVLDLMDVYVTAVLRTPTGPTGMGTLPQERGPRAHAFVGEHS